MISACIAPGVFDGFNIAHKQVIKKLTEQAEKTKSKGIALILTSADINICRMSSPLETQTHIVKAGAHYAISINKFDIPSQIKHWMKFFDFREIICGENFNFIGKMGKEASEILAGIKIINAIAQIVNSQRRIIGKLVVSE